MATNIHLHIGSKTCDRKAKDQGFKRGQIVKLQGTSGRVRIGTFVQSLGNGVAKVKFSGSGIQEVFERDLTPY